MDFTRLHAPRLHSPDPVVTPDGRVYTADALTAMATRYGLDTGEGMPPPRDHRDHPELYGQGWYPMDR